MRRPERGARSGMGHPESGRPIRHGVHAKLLDGPVYSGSEAGGIMGYYNSFLSTQLTGESELPALTEAGYFKDNLVSSWFLL